MYSNITESDIFPVQFCVIRWLENSKACDRAIIMVPKLRIWVQNPATKLSGNKPFLIVKAAVMDPLILAKLHFFKFVSSIVEPFLRRFQSPLPLSPFIWERVESLLRDLMLKFVKPKILIEANTLPKLCNLDLHDTNTCLRTPDIGFGAKEALPPLTSDSADSYYKECKSFFVKLTESVIHKFVENIRCFRDASCISPALLKTKPDLCCSRLTHFLEELVRLKHISVEIADGAKCQFLRLLNDEIFKMKLGGFDSVQDRLDSFFVSIIGDNPDYKELLSVIEKILILSHGNAQVESGFSVNENYMVENLKEESLKALRLISDRIHACEGTLNIPITKELLEFSRFARIRYRAALEKRKVADRATQRRNEIKRKAKEEFEGLQAKRIAIRERMEAEDKLLMQQMKDLRQSIDN